MVSMTTTAASMSANRYADHASRVGAMDARLGRPMMPPPGRRQAAAYRAAYRAARAVKQVGLNEQTCLECGGALEPGGNGHAAECERR